MKDSLASRLVGLDILRDGFAKLSIIEDNRGAIFAQTAANSEANAAAGTRD